ncbi:hypothetical protein I8752_02570 [Nostocaceae cyanobacterium CENA369]|uniref:Uncharacterized protein n=1 Tax=Dendronalium phyllosphericum CENA369 TaxID=1725256 RepID=A0A8J7I3T6_9NOST|nr:hypothetical protein [Dendronalium phyllosphericum]MBH8571932.1 hypothetical protein [Dendronalium phyllosphericum CENA369]
MTGETALLVGFPSEATCVGGFPTPLATTGGTPARQWLDLSKVASGDCVSASGSDAGASPFGDWVKSLFVSRFARLLMS